MKIKTFLKLCKEFKYYKRIVKEYRHELSNGRYYMYPCMRALCKNSERLYYDKYFNNKVSNAKFVPFVRLFNRFFRVKVCTKQLEKKYSAIYIANNTDESREIKLFDRENNVLKIYCADLQSYHKKMDEVQTLEPFFRLVPSFDFDVKSKSFLQKMINIESKRPDERFVLNEIIQSGTTLPILGQVEIKDAIIQAQQYVSVFPELAFVLDRIKEKTPKTIPATISHGDLSTDNFLYGNIGQEENSLYWIDWEHLDTRLFFYDFYFYILNNAVRGNNFEPYYEFINHPNIVAPLFQHFQFAYSEENAKHTFLLFMLFFLLERVLPTKSQKAFEIYYSFIEGFLLK